MGINIKKKTQPQASVTTEHKQSGQVVSEDTKNETPELGTTGEKEGISQPWCEVGFEASYTHNLGNYQSARVGVTLRIPCQHAEIDQVYDIAKEWVNARLQQCVNELEDNG